MKMILAIAVLGLAACGGPAMEMPADAPSDVQAAPTSTTPATQAASSATWTFTAKDVAGTMAITKTPSTDTLSILSGTATVGALSGTISGEENVAVGVFTIYIALPGSRLVQLNGRENGATLSGYVLDTAGFPIDANGRAPNAEPVTGTSP